MTTTYQLRSELQQHEMSAHQRSGNDAAAGAEMCLCCSKEILPSRPSSRHVGRHMEEIAFSVVSKPHEDWSFYSNSSALGHTRSSIGIGNSLASPPDARSAISFGLHKPKTGVAAAEYICLECHTETTFPEEDAILEHMKGIHELAHHAAFASCPYCNKQYVCSLNSWEKFGSNVLAMHEQKAHGQSGKGLRN